MRGEMRQKNYEVGCECVWSPGGWWNVAREVRSNLARHLEGSVAGWWYRIFRIGVGWKRCGSLLQLGGSQ